MRGGLVIGLDVGEWGVCVCVCVCVCVGGGGIEEGLEEGCDSAGCWRSG